MKGLLKNASGIAILLIEQSVSDGQGGQKTIYANGKKFDVVMCHTEDKTYKAITDKINAIKLGDTIRYNDKFYRAVSPNDYLETPPMCTMDLCYTMVEECEECEVVE